MFLFALYFGLLQFVTSSRNLVPHTTNPETTLTIHHIPELAKILKSKFGCLVSVLAYHEAGSGERDDAPQTYADLEVRRVLVTRDEQLSRNVRLFYQLNFPELSFSSWLRWSLISKF
jgi:hypothetical protein